MHWRLIGIAMIACMTASSGFAETVPYPPIFSDAPVKRFSPMENPRFEKMDRELKNLITRRGNTNINNLFCASGFHFPSGNIRTMVIWTNEDQLYWWRGAGSEEEKAESFTLLFSPYSDLKNAVEDGATLSGPTTVNRSQAKATVEDCERYGQKFLVRPFTPEKEKSDDDFDVEDLEYIDSSEAPKKTPRTP